MASRYDQHAQLIKDLYAAGESFTGIARRLQEEYGVPLDASGLRRWLLRRLAKREQRRALLAPTPTQNPAEIAQTVAISQVTRGETEKEKNTDKTHEPKPASTMQEKPKESMSDLIAAVEASEKKSILKR